MRPHLPLALAALLIGAAPASAEPATPTLRIEGRTTTLFEGPLRADGHAVRAAGDVRDRACAGPGPTPTSLAADALALSGQTFAGTWYAGYSDYLITRLGPDSEIPGSWSLLVGGQLTARGGCQLAVPTGTEALWALSASAAQPYLKLTGATTAAPNAPLAVTVTRYDGTAAAGASVVTVQTAADGVQTPAAAGVTTDAAGTATVTFAAPGWHRLKAVQAGAVRSNRLDVCVGECGPAPADTLVRDVVPPAAATPVPTPVPTVAPTPTPQPATIPRLSLSGTRVTLRFPGARPATWTVTATPLGTKAKPLTRTGETFTVPAGREYAFAFDGTSLGTLIAGIDDRKLRYRGRTTRTAAHTRMRKGATATVRLGAGRPILLLGARSKGKVRIAGRTYTARAVTRGAARAKAGTVKLEVRSGSIDLQGVAAGR